MKDYLARQARARNVDLLSLIDLLLRQTLGNPFSWWGVR